MTLLPWDPYAISALSLSHVHSYQKLPYSLATVSRPTLFIKIYMNQSSTENMTLKLSGQSKHSYSKQAFSPPQLHSLINLLLIPYNETMSYL